LRIIFDAGSLINLANGRLLSDLVSTPRYAGHIGPIVRSECKTIASQLDQLISIGKLHALPDVAMPPSSFGMLLNKFNLGLGETECIAFSLQDQFVTSCDDAAARRIIAAEFGAKRLTGTLGLLILAVQDNIVAEDHAFGCYQQMRALGGFLPNLSKVEFGGLLRTRPSHQQKAKAGETSPEQKADKGGEI
jgi:predicted nucleic acid-binding protein